MCGIVGIVSPDPVNQALYDALTNLQHRGQDAAGIMTEENGHLQLRKSTGLVRDVFQEHHMLRLTGNIGLGHVRYPTAGSASMAEAQPFYVNSPYGVALAHNGNLVNTDQLKRLVVEHDRRHLNTNSDTEVLLNVFAHELARQTLGRQTDDRLTPDAILNAVGAVHRRCSGAYAVVAMIIGYGIVAFRDPYGIRPLALGTRRTFSGMERMVASESVALDALGFSLDRDIRPGEGVFIDTSGRVHTREYSGTKPYSPCIFEFVYFARPDSIIDKLSVYKARLRMGEKLAAKILRLRPEHGIDVVIPVPDTSRTAAVQVAHELGVKYREGFMKNRYIGRTFIMPGQDERRASVRRKLNPIGLEFKGKSVLLVDDSIVRGTTSQQIIELAREAGAEKVFFASAAPPVRYPNVYGIDMPAANELVANGRTIEEVQEIVGADWLVYQDLDDLEQAVDHEDADIDGFDTSCFSGKYVTGDVSRDYLAELQVVRSDVAKARRDARVLRDEEGARVEGDSLQAAGGL